MNTGESKEVKIPDGGLMSQTHCKMNELCVHTTYCDDGTK
jgi:hypothetical protein